MFDWVDGQYVQVKQWKGHDFINFQRIQVPLVVRECPGHPGWYAIRPNNTFCKNKFINKHYFIARINDYFTLSPENEIKFYPANILAELKGRKDEKESAGSEEPDSFDELGNSIWNEEISGA